MLAVMVKIIIVIVLIVILVLVAIRIPDSPNNVERHENTGKG